MTTEISVMYSSEKVKLLIAAESELDTEGFTNRLRPIKIVGLLLDGYIKDLASIEGETVKGGHREKGAINAILSCLMMTYCKKYFFT